MMHLRQERYCHSVNQQRLCVLKHVPMLVMNYKKRRVAYVKYTKVHIRKLKRLHLPVQSASSQKGITIESHHSYIIRIHKGLYLIHLRQERYCHSVNQQRLCVLKQVPMLVMNYTTRRVVCVNYTKVRIRKLEHLELPVQSTSSQKGITIASRDGYINASH